MLSKNLRAISLVFMFVGFVGCMGLPVLVNLTQYKLKWLSVVMWLPWGMLCLGQILYAVYYFLQHKRLL